jgi:O-antigen/teichoic acid export membrane protein
MQGLVGLLAGQSDRLIVGYTLGAQALVYYSICVQVAQPIHGIVSAGLHVMFPHLGARLFRADASTMRGKMIAAFSANVVLVAALSVPLFFGGHFLLRCWMGEDFAAHASFPLMLVTASFALMGLNVTGHYILMAMGRVRLLALLNLTAAVAMLLTMALLTPHVGISGAAASRLVYGPITWLSYRALQRTLRLTDGVGGEAPVWRAVEHG